MNRSTSLPNALRAARASCALLTGAVALSLTALASAAAPAPAGADGHGGPEFPISIAKAKERADARFKALDTDHNGVISAQELAAAPMPHWMPRHGEFHHRRGMGREGSPPTSEQRQAWRDKHQDAMQAMDDDLFKRLDANGDGQLSKSEFSADKLRDARHAAMQARIFARLDSDGSGGLSRDELSGMVTRLEAMDTNHDGMVTRDEARAYRRAQHQGGGDDDQG